jgi:7-keto-8-aminopelargonate synthetase-like enzyme
VANGTARLRFTFNPAHSDADIERVADLVKTRVLAVAA